MTWSDRQNPRWLVCVKGGISFCRDHLSRHHLSFHWQMHPQMHPALRWHGQQRQEGTLLAAAPWRQSSASFSCLPPTISFAHSTWWLDSSSGYGGRGWGRGATGYSSKVGALDDYLHGHAGPDLTRWKYTLLSESSCCTLVIKSILVCNCFHSSY